MQPSEKVTTQVRIGIGYSTEEWQRIIRCWHHRQMLRQESKLLGEGSRISVHCALAYPSSPDNSTVVSVDRALPSMGTEH
jgi:hypothetical protein